MQEPITRSLHLPYKPYETTFARIFLFLETVGLLEAFRLARTICYTVQYIEDITRWREGMNFIFEWQNNILRTSAASE